MTEDEAKTKWCPHVRAVSGEIRRLGEKQFQTAVPHGQPAVNRVIDSDGYIHPNGTLCIGSACMAWRWIVDPKLYADMAYDPTNGIRTAGGPTGFCGLAGRPQ